MFWMLCGATGVAQGAACADEYGTVAGWKEVDGAACQDDEEEVACKTLALAEPELFGAGSGTVDGWTEADEATCSTAISV